MSRTGALRPPVDDPDPTDRLPGLDPDAVDIEPEDDPLETTGTWAAPLRSGTVEQAPTGHQLEDRDAAIAELTTLLRQKTFALTRVEKELEQTRSELLRARQAGSHGTEVEGRLREVERERLDLAAQHDEQRMAIARLEDHLSEAREAEQVLEKRLAALQADLETSEQARSAAVERLAEVEAQLERATRESLTAMQQQEQLRLKERITELRNALSVAHEEQDSTVGERDALQARLAQREAELAAAGETLREQGLRVESLLERLRSLEARSRYAADMRRAASVTAGPDDRVVDLERAVEAEREARRQLEAQLAVAGQAPTPAMQRCLTRLDAGSGVVHVLAQDRISIGRTPDNDLQVQESYISRAHALIRLGPESAVIEDLDSRNGVYVNERRVTRELLQDGDVVVLGKARFRFHVTTGHLPRTP